MNNDLDKVDVFYNVFDAVPLNEWVAQKGVMIYKDRTQLVERVISDVNSDRVRQVPHINAKDEAELKAFFAQCMEQGYEGVMLKTLNTPYEFDRSRNIIKLKPCVTYEGVITGWYEGRRGTKREGLFGGFNVVLPNGVVTRVGGGFNDALRAQIQLEDADTWVGKVVEIEAQPDPLTSDGLTKDGKARFPVFMRTRDASDVDDRVIDAFVEYMAKDNDGNE